MKFYSTDSNTQKYQFMVLQIYITKDLVNSRDQSEWMPCLAFRKEKKLGKFNFKYFLKV